MLPWGNPARLFPWTWPVTSEIFTTNVRQICHRRLTLSQLLLNFHSFFLEHSLSNQYFTFTDGFQYIQTINETQSRMIWMLSTIFLWRRLVRELRKAPSDRPICGEHKNLTPFFSLQNRFRFRGLSEIRIKFFFQLLRKNRPLSK